MAPWLPAPVSIKHTKVPGVLVSRNTKTPGTLVYDSAVRDDELRQWLRERNPWWRAAVPGADPLGWVRADVTLRGADALGIDYRPPILADVQPGGLYVVRGPRRVGKSVALKRFAADLLDRADLHPSQVIYLTVDEFDTRAFRRALRLGRELTPAAATLPRFWLIDEVTAVAGWPAVLKSARDDTSLAHDTVVVTGSSAHGLNEARRALGAGRVGPARDPFRLLLPMSFRDFAAAVGRELPGLPAIGAAVTQSQELRDTLTGVVPFADELDLAWQAYCEVGGFPRAVGEFRRSGTVSTEFGTDLVAWLSADVTPDNPPESTLRLLSTLGQRMSAPLNARSVAQATGLSRERLTTRLHRLLATFGAFTCPQVDDEGAPIAGAQSKTYLIDPLLARLPSLVEDGFPVPELPVISEAALAATIARAAERAHPGRLLDGRAVGYARTAAGGEVDFAPMPIRIDTVAQSTTPVESKWVSDGWRPGARAIEGKYGRGFVATKNILDTAHAAWALPAGALALLLE